MDALRAYFSVNKRSGISNHTHVVRSQWHMCIRSTVPILSALGVTIIAMLVLLISNRNVAMYLL